MENEIEEIRAKLTEHGIELEEAALQDIIGLMQDKKKLLNANLDEIDELAKKIAATDDWRQKAAYQARIFNIKNFPFLDT